MGRFIFCAIALLCACAANTVLALPQSRPPVVHFSPTTETYPQNFSIELDRHGNVYLANMEGVLVYDGGRWHHVPLPNGELARWLKSDGRDRVYVGGYDQFGYMTRESNGNYEYRELSTLFGDLLQEDEEFADIWDILITPGGDVYFVALQHLFRYTPGDEKVRVWRHDGRFGPIAWYDDKVYLQFRNDAIRYLDGDKWVAVPDTDRFRHRLTALLPVGDELIIISPDDGILKSDGMQVSSHALFSAAATITHVLPLDQGNLVMASQLGELYFYDLESNEYEKLRVSNGFITGTVKSGSGELLVVDDTGFYAVRWPTRWRRIGAEAGLIGSVHAVRHRDDTVYVLTTSGVFRADGDAASFERLDWTDNEAWDLLLLEDGSAILAESYELILVDGERRVSITGKDNTPRVLRQSTYDPDIIYVGTELGMQVLQKDGTNWRVVYRNDEMGIPGVWSLFEIAPNMLMIGSDRAGIQVLNFLPGEDWRMTARMLGPEDGIEYLADIPGGYLYDLPQGLYAGTDVGYYRWNGERFEPDTVLGLADYDNDTFFDLASDGQTLWAFDYDTLLRFDGDWVEEDTTALRNLALTMIYFMNGHMLVGDESALLVFDNLEIPPSNSARPLQMTLAEQRLPDGSVKRLSEEDLGLLAPDGRIAFRFALPEFRKPDAVRYRMQLAPLHKDFSDWSEGAGISLGELEAGSYELRVEARDGLGRVSATKLDLTIVPRWYESTPMRIVWVLLAIIAMAVLVWSLVHFRSRQLERERDRLEEMVAERTRALESANRQLEQMAHLDSLTQIPNRRRLDHYLEDVWTQCVERSRVMSVALIDVDHFKKYNDQHGHVAGDELLIELARLLSRNLRRAEDLVARYGGEEFLVVLPGAEPLTARAVVESMRNAVETSSLGITISAGICSTGPDTSRTVTDLIEEADAALYRAKDAGRNRIEPSDQLPLAGL